MKGVNFAIPDELQTQRSLAAGTSISERLPVRMQRQQRGHNPGRQLHRWQKGGTGLIERGGKFATKVSGLL